ncbi:MAG: class I SAM-dependent methyltransferase [Bacteroidia bacterium]|nr:class I SAM-dependent methyltransferase [Bacteroidia bacterium]
MKNRSIISAGDFIELYGKLKLNNLPNLLQKLSPRQSERVISTWNVQDKGNSNWWIVPQVRARLNELMTGDANVVYEEYLVKKYLADKQDLTLLSIGCGTGTHELRLAHSGKFGLVEGWDIAPKLIEQCKHEATTQSLTNTAFRVVDVNRSTPQQDAYDVVLFNSSLHHFSDIESMIRDKVLPALRDKGLLFVYEYIGPNRLQWTDEQLTLCDEALRLIPKAFRQYQWGAHKSRVYRPGVLRMVVNDPSEAANSRAILPILRSYLQPLEEKPVKGNILHPLLKGIAHNFLAPSSESDRILQDLFTFEDKAVTTVDDSDFMFGVYQKG